MKKVLLTVLFIFGFSYATSWTTYDTYKSFKPQWEIKTTKSEVPVFSIHVEGRLRGATCGIESSAFYRLSMMLNKDTLDDLVHNWKSLALVASFYTLGTFFPILKEAMVGAEIIADNIAKLRNLDCNSAMEMMNHYYKGTSRIVRSCVLKRIDPKLNVWSASKKEIAEAIEKAGEPKVKEAYNYCMNNANLFDVFNTNEELSKWLKLNNLRRWIACNYVSAFGLKDLGSKYEAKDMLLNGGDALTMAKIGLLAITPEWIVDKRTKRLILKPIVDESGNPINISKLEEIIKGGVDKEIDKLVAYLWTTPPDTVSFYNDLKDMNDKFFIDNEKVRPYFDFIVLTITKIKELERKGETIKATELKALLDDYLDTLKENYYLLKVQSVRNKLYEYYNQMKMKKQAEKVGTKGGIDAYCK